MQYIENDGHVTREYEVRINTDELKNIIRDLDTKCYRIVNKKIKVVASDKEEAIKKVNMAINSVGMKVNELVKISDGYKDLIDYPGSLLVFDCDCLCKQNSSLVSILERILDNYNSTVNFKKQNNRLIDFLIGYENSDELKTYIERIRVDDSDSVLQESIYNENYDFGLLRDLYKRAKDCFELVLISETIHYKDIDESPKIYKLGTKKYI